MILTTMRFASFEWQHNPLSVEITHRRKYIEESMPLYGSKITDMGRGLTVISGKGELAGSDCLEQYKRLEKVFLRGEKGVLTVPSLKPVHAYFTKLSVVGETTADLITYTFEFTEAESFEDSSAKKKYHLCKEGETLFDIAYDEGVSVDELVRLNPWVKRPDELKEGEKVRLC